MSSNQTYIPFSQRSGLTPVPPQLKLNEASKQLRLLLDYSLASEVDRFSLRGFDHNYFDDKWRVVASDLHVRFFKRPISTFKNSCFDFKREMEVYFAKTEIGPLFDLVELLIRHPACSITYKQDVAEAFVTARAAYRVIDGQIVATGTEAQAKAFEVAIIAAETVGSIGAKHHLVASGLALRNGEWANSVRESIHAVEAAARMIAPDSNTLGPALKELERRLYIHGSLRAAFDKLYGYTNDEGGIRHALLDDEAKVDEADALFMLGACASFVSYLIARTTVAPLD